MECISNTPKNISFIGMIIRTLSKSLNSPRPLFIISTITMIFPSSAFCSYLSFLFPCPTVINDSCLPAPLLFPPISRNWGESVAGGLVESKFGYRLQASGNTLHFVSAHGRSRGAMLESSYAEYSKNYKQDETQSHSSPS